ncbi:MAG: hypothetical protein ACI37R_02045 [Candidatus Avigastranaerophilus sp.]
MKKNKKLVIIICFVTAALLFVCILVSMIKGNVEDIQNAKAMSIEAEQNAQRLEQQAKELAEQQAQEKSKLNSIKPVIQEPDDSDGESLGVFGGMFDKVIALSKESGLLLRSIEYEMNPMDDAIYQNFSDIYNVCELKFFFVGSYTQLRSFLDAMVNKFEYLVSISRLNVTAFSENTDYILINMSITLYSKKASSAAL